MTDLFFIIIRSYRLREVNFIFSDSTEKNKILTYLYMDIFYIDQYPF